MEISTENIVLFIDPPKWLTPYQWKSRQKKSKAINILTERAQINALQEQQNVLISRNLILCKWRICDAWLDQRMER